MLLRATAEISDQLVHPSKTFPLDPLETVIPGSSKDLKGVFMQNFSCSHPCRSVGVLHQHLPYLAAPRLHPLTLRSLWISAWATSLDQQDGDVRSGGAMYIWWPRGPEWGVRFPTASPCPRSPRSVFQHLFKNSHDFEFSTECMKVITWEFRARKLPWDF